MTTTTQAFVDQVQTDFEAHWNDLTAIAWENVDFDPKASPNGFASFAIEHDGGAELGLGDTPDRELGTLIINCYGPEESGVAIAYDLAERAIQFVETWTPVDATRLLRNPTINEQGATAGWWIVQVSAELAYDRA